MDFTATAVIAFTVFYLVLFYYENFWNAKQRPPGPIRLPPWGNLLHVGLRGIVAHVAFHKMAKKYGDVMSVKMGLKEMVILSSYESVKTIYTKEEATGRDCTGFLWDRNMRQNIGLILGDGPVQSQARKFCLSTLRLYGYGDREAMQNLLLDELNSEFLKFVENEMKSNPEGRIRFQNDFFHKCFLNIMSTWMIGKRFKYDDPQLHDLVKYHHLFDVGRTIGPGLMMAYPFVRHIFPETVGFNAQLKGVAGFRSIAMKHFHEREKTTYKTSPECFTDCFLQEMDKEKNSAEKKFTKDQFAVIFSDIVEAGTDTSSNVVNFILLHLATNQNIQDKVYQEILDVIGSSRLPSLENKNSMPYIQAVILEGLRWNRVLVFGAPRRATQDIKYRNFLIKKDTMMLYNLQSIFFDEDFWGDPHVFRPERFFDSNGNLNPQKMNIIQVVFGAGRRVCFGEVFARDSLFIFVTTILQKFKFRLPEGSKPNLEPIVGFTLYAAPYDAIVTLRKQ